MSSDRQTLKVAPREEYGSRSSRRLRSTGLVPGIVYGHGDEARPFQVAERDLRPILAHGGTLIDLEIEGSKTVPAVVKEQQRHPVRGDLLHIDLLEVDLSVSIQSEVAVELEGADVAPGVKLGGVLEHITHSVLVESLPTEIPETLVIDISELEIGETLTLDKVVVPEGVTLIADNPEEIAIVTISAPRVSATSDEEVEEEAEVVGGGESAEADSAGGDEE